jgi:predicted dehydrogenase
MDKVKAAIVGCGRISDLHEIGYRQRDDAAIVAVCDTNKKRAKNKAEAWGVAKVFTDFDLLLADPEVNLVELLVPHHLHAAMTVAACEAGKHVSVQKPMALTGAEAQAMIDAAERAGVLLRVYENFVFYPPVVRAQEMLQAGEIGEPQMIRIHYNSGTRSSGWDVPLNAWIWRFDEERCGGGPIIFDHGYHLFSLARFFMGEVEKVSAWIDRSKVIPTRYVDTRRRS